MGPGREGAALRSPRKPRTFASPHVTKGLVLGVCRADGRRPPGACGIHITRLRDSPRQRHEGRGVPAGAPRRRRVPGPGAARGCSETTCTVKRQPLGPPRLGGAGAQGAEPLTSLAGLRWRRRRGLALPRPARRRSAGVTAATPEAGLVRVVAGQRAGAGRSDSGLPAASAGGGAKRPRWVPAGARRRGPSAPKPAPRGPRARPPPGPQRLSPTPGCLPALPARGRPRAPHRTLGDPWALTPPGFPYLCPPGPGRTPQLVRLPASVLRAAASVAFPG